MSGPPSCAASVRLDHRADIEGLRGVAVIAVMAVHAWPEVLRGGFIGVDMFFVLSGFLITSLMFGAMEQGRFSLGTFYRRRVLRLFPALCTVLLCCIAAAAFVFPGEARQIGKHIAASAVFASNIALWQEAGYFDASSESKPLLHLWSLGIEEQFYLLWPPAVLMIFRWRQHAFKIVLAVALMSFALNVMWVVPKAKGTFFLLPTRAWELLVGAVLATVQRYGSGVPALAAAARHVAASRLSPHLRELAAWGGVALIVAAFALLDKQSSFPGWWALLPTLGTVLLLAAGNAAWFNRHVLSHPVMVFYGAISYPLYLWHWPLLVFPGLLGVELDNATRVLIMAASVALAALTTEYIERPIRFGFGRPRAPLALGAAMACIGTAGLALHLSDGLVHTYPSSVREIARADLDVDFDGYRPRRCFLDLETGPGAFADECWPKAAKGPHTLLWGDSHAAALYPGMAAAFAQSGSDHDLAQITKARCPPVSNPLPTAVSRRCAEANAYAMGLVRRQAPEVVVLAGYWSLYAREPQGAELTMAGLRETVLLLRAAGVRHVVVVGHLPAWTVPLPRVLLREWARAGTVPERTLTALDPEAPRLDAVVRAAVADTGAVFVSPFDRLCDARGCLVTQRRDGVSHPLVHDESHFTLRGSMAFMDQTRDVLLR